MEQWVRTGKAPTWSYAPYKVIKESRRNSTENGVVVAIVVLCRDGVLIVFVPLLFVVYFS
jgi:hypothetical protein